MKRKTPRLICINCHERPAMRGEALCYDCVRLMFGDIASFSGQPVARKAPAWSNRSRGPGHAPHDRRAHNRWRNWWRRYKAANL